jgi:REP element-mobilizing transposase RayT
VEAKRRHTSGSSWIDGISIEEVPVPTVQEAPRHPLAKAFRTESTRVQSSRPKSGHLKREKVKHPKVVTRALTKDSTLETIASPINPEGVLKAQARTPHNTTNINTINPEGVLRTQAGVPTPDTNDSINYSPERAKEQENDMASSLVKITIHLIFRIKKAGVDIRNEDLSRIHRYIGGIIKGKGGIPIEIGGTHNHVHILTSLPKSMTLTDYIREIKTNSSKWIKQLDGHYAQFAWQDGYGAFSVSPSLLDKAIQYIRGQEEHHKTRTFNEEYRLFLEAYGIDYDERYAFND